MFRLIFNTEMFLPNKEKANHIIDQRKDIKRFICFEIMISAFVIAFAVIFSEYAKRTLWSIGYHQ